MFTVLLSIHLVICVFLVILVLLQKSEGGGLGIGQSGGGIGDFMTSRSAANFLTKTTTFLTSFGLAFLANKTYNKKSILDSSEDAIIDRLDLIPEEFDVESDNKNEIEVPVE